MHTSGLPGGLPPFRPPSSPSPFDSLYEEMLARVSVTRFHAEKLPQLPPISLEPYSRRTLVWRNFLAVTQALARPPSHVVSFLVSHFCPSLAVAQVGLILPVTTKPATIRRALAEYQETYVRCKRCSSCNTELTRDTEARTYQLQCSECLTVRTTEVLLKGSHQGAKAERLLHSI